MNRILRWLTDDALADSIAGDLREQYVTRARRSRLWAVAWLVGSVATLAVELLARRSVGLLHEVLRAAGRQPDELRQVARSLRQSPWYSTTFVGVVALGMALSATVFAVVDGVLFRPLPYPNAQEVYLMSGGFRTSATFRGPVVSAADYRDWAASVPDVLVAATGFHGPLRTASLDGRGIWALSVSADLFDVLGVRPLLGGFDDDDFASPASRPILISHAIWQQELGGRADVVGSTWVPVDGGSEYRVSGVLPRGFVFPTDREQPEVLRPLVLRAQDFENRRRRMLSLVARIPSALPFSEVQATLDSAAERLIPDFPATNGRGPANQPYERVLLAPVADVLTAEATQTFALASSAAGLLILLAALNLAGLAAARAEDRLHHVALRRALGAGPCALTRLQLTEALLLAVAGSVAGLALSPALLGWTLRLLPTDITLIKTPAIDGRVLLFAALTTGLLAALVSVWPSLVGIRGGLSPLLARESARSTRSGQAGRVLIVGTQVSVAFVLINGGLLMVGSLAAVWQQDPGYERQSVITIEAQLFDRDEAVQRSRETELAQRIRAVPGVSDVTVLGGYFLRNTWAATVGWEVPEGANDGCLAGAKVGIDDRFIDVMGLDVVAGRSITPGDIEGSDPVALVDARTAELCWPDDTAVGETVVVAGTPFTVLGVVANARLLTLDQTPSSDAYFPRAALPASYQQTVAARVVGDVDDVMSAVVSAVRVSDFRADVVRVATVDAALADSVRPRRLTAWIFGGFAVAGLVVVAVGILGLVAMTVARRTREIGIRYALGDTPRGIVRLLVREQLLSVAAGLIVGAVVSLWVVGFLESYLYGVTATSPTIWAGACAVLLTTAVLGSIIPALRASYTDPVEALRSE